MYYEIYKYICNENNRYYVGCHFTENGTEKDRYYGSGCNQDYWNDRKRYGDDNFSLEVLATAKDKEEAQELEYKYVVPMRDDPLSYNLLAGGGLSGPNSEKHCESISKALTGREFTKEHRVNLSRTHTGMKRSKDHCKNTSKGMIGHVVSEETKKKISEGNLGKVQSKETCEAISNALTGRLLSKEHRKKISKALSGRKLNEETKEKLRNNRITIKCPFCLVESKNKGNMNRYHFDNCKNK